MSQEKLKEHVKRETKLRRNEWKKKRGDRNHRRTGKIKERNGEEWKENG